MKKDKSKKKSKQLRLMDVVVVRSKKRKLKPEEFSEFRKAALKELEEKNGKG